MTDLLVKLYDLPDLKPALDAAGEQEVVVRRAMASEKRLVTSWVKGLFGDGWASECDVAFSRMPIACVIAISGNRIIGFACHDSTCRNFFGPIGIDPAYRQKGIGRTVLLYTMHAMAQAGFAYAIIGAAGPMGFFEKWVNAFPIPGSTPGIYPTPIKNQRL